MIDGNTIVDLKINYINELSKIVFKMQQVRDKTDVYYGFLEGKETLLRKVIEDLEELTK